MKIIEYSELSATREIQQKIGSRLYAHGIYGELSPWLSQFFDRYNLGMRLDTEKVIALKLSQQLSAIITALEGKIEGKRILDLGSGSNGGVEDGLFNPELYQPWLCRMLLELGSVPIGVDYGNFAIEPFETMQANLREADSLAFINEESVDLAHAHQLFNSPQLERLTTGLGWGHGSPETGEALAHSLKPELSRVLTPEGIFVYYADISQYGSTVSRSPRYRSWPFAR